MRSLIGEGVRTILKIIRKEFSKLRIKKSKSRTNVFDWNISETLVFMKKTRRKFLQYFILI